MLTKDGEFSLETGQAILISQLVVQKKIFWALHKSSVALLNGLPLFSGSFALNIWSSSGEATEGDRRKQFEMN